VSVGKRDRSGESCEFAFDCSDVTVGSLVKVGGEVVVRSEKVPHGVSNLSNFDHHGRP
jgi:hypothetical protein